MCAHSPPVSPQHSDSWLLSCFGGPGQSEGWLAFALASGTLISEDLACVAAGLFAASDRIGLPLAMVACAVGIWVGDVGLWVIGWLASRGLLRSAWVRRRLAGVGTGAWRRALDRHGTKILFVTRFVPGTRTVTYLAAGAVGWPLRRFASVLGFAVVLWVPLIVGMSAASGEVVLEVLAGWSAHAWIAVPIALLVAWTLIRTLPLLFTWRGRRLLWGRWRRLSAWEYWPSWLVFPPLALDLVRLAIVHRTPAVFSACNRGIPFGGLVGESKGDILDLFPRGDAGGAAAGGAGGVAVARYVRLAKAAPLGERLAAVRPFLAAGRCVLKPDQGERGAGVAVVRDEASARAWLAACPFDAIVQEFVEGAEFGVAWCRDPRTGKGEIHSIAHKVLPQVTGDGERSLEDLILADDRAAPMARFHFAAHEGRLETVPGAGEIVRLGDLGTHARGATFFDARELATPALREAFERFLQDVPGVDFGRFDLRAPDADALREGRDIRILEFNGVTGEAAHVYQPGYPWRRGIADMIAHMRRAAAIGAANRAAGHRPATLGQLARVVVAALRRPRFEAREALAAVARGDLAAMGSEPGAARISAPPSGVQADPAATGRSPAAQRSP